MRLLKTTWTPILVPTEHYIDIATMIQQRLDELGFEATTGSTIDIRLLPQAPAEDNHGVQAALDNHVPWAIENLTALIHNPTATAQRWRMAIDVCMNHIGEFIPTETIAAESGMSVNVWRSACRKMTVHQRATYPSEATWPLATASGRDIGEPVGPLYVALTEEQATRWSEAKTKADVR